jgi:hypothetical protein
VLEKDGEGQWDPSREKWISITQSQGGKELRRTKADLIGHILRRNCFLKQVIEGKIEERREVTGKRGRRCKQLLDDLKEKTGYWKLKEEALHCALWRRCFGRGYGPFLRQTAKWMNEKNLSGTEAAAVCMYTTEQIYWLFGVDSSSRGRGSRFCKNVSKILPIYTASHLSHRLENLKSSTKSNLLGKIFPQMCDSWNFITVVRRALFEESLAVTLRTTRFYIEEFYVVFTLRLCVL